MQPAASVPPRLIPLPGARDLPGAGPHAVSVEGVDLVLLRTAQGPRVFQNRCPHQGALLSEGELDKGVLICRNHRWRFDEDTGRRLGGPECLASCPAVADGQDVLIEAEALRTLQASTSKAEPRANGKRRQVSMLPGPRGLPGIGNLFSLDLSRLHLILEGWGRTHGSLYRLRLGGKQALVVSEPALVQAIFKERPHVYRRTSKLAKVFEELGVAGVFSAEGSAWRNQRKLAMEALAQRNLRGFYPTLHKVAARLSRRWERAADEQTPVDIVEDLKRFTVDVTTALTFGTDINTIEQTGDAVVQRRLELLFPTFQRRIFAQLPLWRWLRLPRDRAVDAAVAELRTWLDGLVREARARFDDRNERAGAPAPTPAHFLEAMVAARDEHDQPFSDQVIFGNLMTMLLAGEDTTAYTLAWAVHHLCDSPDAVTALQSELDALGSEGPVPAELDAAQGLTYAGAIANETMRLRPVAPLLIFETLVPTSLGDIDLPEEAILIALTRPANLTPERFFEPTRFLPGRWLQAAANADATGTTGAAADSAPASDLRPHDPSAHVPFGSGPRICPGRSLALLEMKVALAALYGRFEVSRTPSSPAVNERFAFTMFPEGISVMLRRRTT